MKSKVHWHSCPECKRAFACTGEKCESVQGIAHKACVSKPNKFTKWTKELLTVAKDG